ncbi:unnamed protein product, partial [Ectocarpus sp. 13 AM-2016]
MVPYASLRRAGMSHILPEPNIFILVGQHFPQPFFRAQNVHEIFVSGISGITITSPAAAPAHACHNLITSHHVHVLLPSRPELRAGFFCGLR